MINKPFLTVVVPAYNEASNFRDGVLNPSVAWLQKQPFDYEVIFVNDGSTDDTQQVLEPFCRAHKDFRLLTIAHGGKVAAVSAGMLDAKGDLIIFTDFDQSTPLNQAEKLLASHNNGSDLVIGNRGIATMDNNLFRRFRSWVFVTLVQVVLLPKIHDSQCGFKSFKNPAAKKIFKNLRVTNLHQVSGGYMGAWDAEALFLAQKFGYKIAEVEVDWKKVEGKRLNPVTEPIKMLADILKIRLFDLLGRYN